MICVTLLTYFTERLTILCDVFINIRNKMYTEGVASGWNHQQTSFIKFEKMYDIQ